MLPQTVFITKYALTAGIREVELLDMLHDDRMVKVQYRPRNGWDSGTAYFHARDWHHTRAEALARAEEMRKKRIDSLKKSIEKVEKLDLTQVHDAR